MSLKVRKYLLLPVLVIAYLGGETFNLFNGTLAKILVCDSILLGVVIFLLLLCVYCVFAADLVAFFRIFGLVITLVFLICYFA